MEARAEALVDIVSEIAPATVRQVFYQATVRGVIEKTEAGYAKVQRLLAQLRRAGDIDYHDTARHIEETLRELAPDAEINFERLAVTPYLIDWLDLPGRPTKRSDTRSKYWRGDSVELDAINPDQLRHIVQITIEAHLSPEQFRVLKVAEESEREVLQSWVESLEAAE